MPRTACHQHRLKVVRRLPICRFCLAEAAYESKTASGNWTGMCAADFQRQGNSTEYRCLLSYGSAWGDTAA